MPQTTRVTDRCTGHDACPPIGLQTGSENVLINGLPAGRKTDKYNLHSCVVHAPHPDVIVGGSKTVFINGLPVARVDDSVSLAGKVMEGSKNVIIGD